MNERLRSLHPERLGVICAASAFLGWGLIPIYIKQIHEAGAVEIIAHRVVWSALFVGLLILSSCGLGELRRVLRTPRILAALSLSAACISVNWLIFTWAVNDGRVLETSLGYFINPLLSVALGVLLLRERLRPAQQAAVALAGAAVLQSVFSYGAFPWVALSLATTFALYGLLRKHVPVDAPTGLLVETIVLMPFALGYMAWLRGQGADSFDLIERPGLSGLLLLAGPVTATPLMLFAAGARRLPLSTIGFLQYIAPSMTFLLAVFVYGEPFSMHRLATFALIWIGLALFSVDSALAGRRAAPSTPVATRVCTAGDQG